MLEDACYLLALPHLNLASKCQLTMPPHVPIYRVEHDSANQVRSTVPLGCAISAQNTGLVPAPPLIPITNGWEIHTGLQHSLCPSHPAVASTSELWKPAPQASALQLWSAWLHRSGRNVNCGWHDLTDPVVITWRQTDTACDRGCRRGSRLPCAVSEGEECSWFSA